MQRDSSLLLGATNPVCFGTKSCLCFMLSWWINLNGDAIDSPSNIFFSTKGSNELDDGLTLRYDGWMNRVVGLERTRDALCEYDFPLTSNVWHHMVYQKGVCGLTVDGNFTNGTIISKSVSSTTSAAPAKSLRFGNGRSICKLFL